MKHDRVPLVIGAATLLAHALVAGRYGFFRDELYFIDCGRHPAFGYVDQPPLIPLVAAATQIFGHCLPLLRLVSALLHAATVLVTAAFARLVAEEIEGDESVIAYAPALAAACVSLAPMYLGLHSTLNTTSGEALAWTSVAYLMARAALRDDRRALVLAGIVTGVTLEAKYALPFFLAPLLVGLLASPARRLFARREMALAVLAATVLAAPSAVWQLTHHLPFLELLRAGANGKNAVVPMSEFVLNQIAVMNLALAPVWLAGAGAALFARSYARVRFLGVAFVGVFALMLLMHGKDYYVAPAYGTAFAVGAVFVASHVRRTWMRAAHLGIAVALGAIAAPLAMPILDPPVLPRYMQALHLTSQAQENLAKTAVLPQEFADMLGWQELEARVAEVYRTLTPDERARAAIITSNYGEAGALDFYGGADGLPPAMSGHNQFFLWGTHGKDGSVVLRVNGNLERWRSDCRDVSVPATFGVPLAMPYESDRPIVLCRGLKERLEDSWPGFKHYE